MKFGTPLIINLLGGARLKVAKRPGEKWQRRKSNAAQISDLIALKRTLALCGTCERRMPRKWGNRSGYRMLHNMHTETNCDFQGPECEGYAACNLFHPVEEGYYRQWEELQETHKRVAKQQIELRDKRRIKAFA